MVAFSESLECIQTTINLTDYSSNEKAATWYDAKDIYIFRQHRRETVRKLEEGQIGGCCIRGLERLTREGSRQRHERLVEGLNAVLDEQDLQEMDGREKPEMLAHIYRLHTLRSRVAAYERGLQDQQEVHISCAMDQ
jgi:hypothetical protein